MKLIPFPKRGRDVRLRTAIKTETTLYGALKSLFDLLEKYSPVWYTKHYHDKAQAALMMHERTLKKGHRDSRKAA